MALEALSRKIMLECPEELLYSDDLALVSETCEVQAVIPPYANFAGVGCIKDVVVLEENGKWKASLDVKQVQISKQTQQGIVQAQNYMATGGTFDSTVTRTRSGQCKLRDLVPLVASKDLSLGAKDMCPECYAI